MTSELTIVQVLVQGGAVGLALGSLYVIYKMATNHTKHIEESTNRFTQAMDRNTDGWIKNAEAMASLKERLDR